VFCSENGTPLSQSNLTRQLNALLRRAEFPDIRFHDLRHTYAALSIAAGVDIYTLSRWMSHSSISVTADRYGHLYRTKHQQRLAMQLLIDIKYIVVLRSALSSEDWERRGCVCPLMSATAF
jgi:integrase